jgi:DeoR C terminal sensor domain
VPSEGAIILDAGTTTARLAQVLAGDRELTVVVNSPVLAMTLGARRDINVLLLGGRLRGTALAAVDDWALRSLADLCVDVAFLGTNGCSVGAWPTTMGPAETAVKRAMIAAARRSVLLAGHTKTGNDCLARFGSLSDIDVLISRTAASTNESVCAVEAGGCPGGPRMIIISITAMTMKMSSGSPELHVAVCVGGDTGWDRPGHEPGGSSVQTVIRSGGVTSELRCTCTC